MGYILISALVVTVEIFLAYFLSHYLRESYFIDLYSSFNFSHTVQFLLHIFDSMVAYFLSSLFVFWIILSFTGKKIDNFFFQGIQKVFGEIIDNPREKLFIYTILIKQMLYGVLFFLYTLFLLLLYVSDGKGIMLVFQISFPLTLILLLVLFLVNVLFFSKNEESKNYNEQYIQFLSQKVQQDYRKNVSKVFFIFFSGLLLISGIFFVIRSIEQVQSVASYALFYGLGLLLLVQFVFSLVRQVLYGTEYKRVFYQDGGKEEGGDNLQEMRNIGSAMSFLKGYIFIGFLISFSFLMIHKVEERFYTDIFIISLIFISLLLLSIPKQ